MIRAWLFLIPRVIGEQLPAARFVHSPGNYGRAFVISSTRFQPSKYCPRTEPILENCGTPTLIFGEALDSCLPFCPRQSCFLASSVPGHDQKQRRILVL